ncbi:MAG: gamma-glutamyltransferase [Actinomycetota bacterium]|nr:gamma-glutamyltransferase [Actinomycetota bacterium]
MAKPRIAVAAGSKSGTRAAANVAAAGGNAVDACLASAVMGWVAEPFFASAGGSAFVAVRTPDGVVEIIDGNAMMPTTAPEPDMGLERVYLDYSNGMYTHIGAGAVAVPGAVAAIHSAWERHGHIEWGALFADAITAARDGFPFPKTSDFYLSVTADPIWCKDPAAREIFIPGRELLREGETIRQNELAEALQMIADGGPEVFYSGALAEEIVEVLRARDGFMTAEDLASYSAEIRTPIATDAFGWEIQSNPPPSVGGAVLVHMLALLEGADLKEPVARLSAIVEAQRAAVGYRRERYQDASEIAVAFEEALNELRSRALSSETTHTSTADADGYACSLTESNGYGAGVTVHGILMNNTLGEEELNPMGVHRLPPGSRCHSSMAPTIATGAGTTVALGSPGADRIVSAIVQTFIRLAVDNATLQEAVAGPRAHLDPRPDGELLCYELDLPGDQLPYVSKHFDEVHMYFGGVQAASVTDDGVVDAVFDPRRSGGVALI